MAKLSNLVTSVQQVRYPRPEGVRDVKLGLYLKQVMYCISDVAKSFNWFRFVQQVRYPRPGGVRDVKLGIYPE